MLRMGCGSFSKTPGAAERRSRMDFEDLDFFKMDCATAMSFDYEMNYNMKQLKHIAGYYGIKNKTTPIA